MAKNADLARIYGGDDDAIWLAPIGTDTTAITITTDLSADAAFEEVGWLETDTGFTESATGSVEKKRAHQGNRVIRTRISESGTTIAFVALEDKAQTRELRYDITSSSTTLGVRTEERTPGQKVAKRVCVIDKFDADDDTVQERTIIDVFEISANGDRTYVNADIAAFPFIGEVISNYTVLSTDVENPGE